MNEEMNEENYSNPDVIDIMVERKKNSILNGHHYMLLPELRDRLDELTMLAGLAIKVKAPDNFVPQKFF
jgi:hypothetical protein